MLKDKNDRKIEELMNAKGYSHAEAMAALKKEDEGKDSGESKDLSGSDEEIGLPSKLLPQVSVGKDIDFHLCGEVTEIADDVVYVKPRDFNCSVREPYKETGNVKAIAVDR